MERAGISDPKKCYLVDDSVKNIVGAQKMGWNTVLLSLQTPDTSIDLDIGHHQGSRIDEIYDLPKAIPELF
ncbi:hypothetical protein AX774_g6810 [Zancudomyces culisetae]|uniref:Uncharacterized protein n=1 Tax=Zancudomyces culisetae TaxID=1213189 RepID=A0A1R1PFN3_ZANCU|nr:hypothetical protein AX774_g6810 [Zancudomyces culisetae]|eukprot:OMH79767.1 hypothetical protein AX774_g6810 [Zancudomyces culisetae]